MAYLAKRPHECEILIVDDEEIICSLLQRTLKDLYHVFTCQNVDDALALIDSHDFDVVIADLNLGNSSGLDVLKAARKKDDFTEMLIITGFASLETAAIAIEIGVSSYLLKPISMPDLLIQVEKAVASRLFHLKSIMLSKYADTVSPEIKGHLYDVASLFHFSRKLMLSLELPEVMRVILEEINERMGTLYSIIAVQCQEVNEFFVMPRVGTLQPGFVKTSIGSQWENAFGFIDKSSFESNEIPISVYNGRHDAEGTFTEGTPLIVHLTIMDKTIGSLVLMFPKDYVPGQDDTQFLYVFTSYIASAIEHSCIDLHAKLQARTDGLTGIANHRSFHETLSREIARADRNHTTFGLMLLDLDNFKKVNDTYGHLIGDAILRTLSIRVQNLIRRADTFARYGGEEFGLIMPDTGLDGAKVLAQRICTDISATPYCGSQLTVHFSASIGLSIYNGDTPRSKNDLISDADKALYQSKRDGKNRFSVQ